MNKEISLEEFVGFSDSTEDTVDIADVSFETKTVKDEDIDFADEEEEKPKKQTTKKLSQEEEEVKKLEESEVIDFEVEDAYADTFETEDVTPSKNKKETLRSTSLEAFKFLKEKGIVVSEEDPQDDITASELVETAWESSLDSYVEDMVKDLPTEAKNLLKFVKEGGDAYEYLKTLKQNADSLINKNSDITKEETQERVIRVSLEKEGYEEDYIEDHLASLKETGKLAKYSKSLFDKIVQKQVQEEEQAIKNVETRRKESLTKLRNQQRELSSYLETINEVKGIALSKEDKKSFTTYLTEPSIELPNGNKITPFYKELFEAAQDKETSVLLAKLLKSKFDFSSVSKKAISEKTKEVNSNLRNQGNKKPANKQKVGIWELID
jgi:hypothetical protein